MLPGDPAKPVNLTAAVELGRMTDATETTSVLSRGRLSFSILAIGGLGAVVERAETDLLYVIMAGYGILHCGDGERIEFTAGDVMVVPAGALHRFEEVAPKFKTWRIEVGSPTGAVVEHEGPARSSP